MRNQGSPEKMNREKAWRILFLCLFVAYTLLMLQKTLLRSYHIKNPLGQLWSAWFLSGNRWQYGDAIVNTVMMTPFMYFFFKAFPSLIEGGRKKTILLGMAISFLCSLMIESGQLILCVGTFQISDLVHNTMSGAIGAYIATLTFPVPRIEMAADVGITVASEIIYLRLLFRRISGINYTGSFVLLNVFLAASVVCVRWKLLAKRKHLTGLVFALFVGFGAYFLISC